MVLQLIMWRLSKKKGNTNLKWYKEINIIYYMYWIFIKNPNPVFSIETADSNFCVAMHLIFKFIPAIILTLNFCYRQQWKLWVQQERWRKQQWILHRRLEGLLLDPPCHVCRWARESLTSIYQPWVRLSCVLVVKHLLLSGFYLFWTV